MSVKIETVIVNGKEKDAVVVSETDTTKDVILVEGLISTDINYLNKVSNGQIKDVEEPTFQELFESIKLPNGKTAAELYKTVIKTIEYDSEEEILEGVVTDEPEQEEIPEDDEPPVEQ